MERKAIKVGQLLAILNQRMMRQAETRKCRVMSISPVMHPAGNQCNWSSAVNWNAFGQDREAAMPIVRKVVMNAQREFDILPIGTS